MTCQKISILFINDLSIIEIFIYKLILSDHMVIFDISQLSEQNALKRINLIDKQLREKYDNQQP